MAVYPAPGYTPYTYGQITGVIDQYANVYKIPGQLAKAIAWLESTFNPNAAGDWIDASGRPVPANTPGAHPRSIGLFQLNREGGQGAGLSLSELVDPRFNANIALKNLAATPHGESSAGWGAWAAASQRPADPAAYAARINQLVISAPWQTLDLDDPANPDPTHGGPPGPGGGGPTNPPSDLPTVPGPADPGETGSGLPNLFEADPVVLGHIPGIGDVTLNLTPVLNWGLRIGLTVVAGGLIVGGIVVLARPVTEYAQEQAGKVMQVAAVAA